LLESRTKSMMRKIVTCWMIFMLLGFLWVAQPGTAAADPFSESEAAASLTIRAGYSDGAFTEMKVFTDNDFAGAFQREYSFMDSMPSPCMDAVTGILLTDLLSEAGIDFDKINSFAFYTTDVPNRPYKTLDKSFLYLPRFYYPNEMKYWNSNTCNFLSEDSVTDFTYKAVEDAIQVYPMICVSDNWVRGAMEPDFSTQDDSTKYRLAIGQPYNDPAEITAPYSIKWIYQIDVTLIGASPSNGGSASGGSTPIVSVSGVSLDKSADVLNVGSTSQLTATVVPESASNKAATWKSSNDAVATVSDAGLVTAVAPGSADITVTTIDGGKTAACAVTVNPATATTVPGSDAQVNIPEGALNGITGLNDIAGHWAESSIKKLAALGAVGGYPDGSFKPDKFITRGEFVTVLVKAFKLAPEGGKAFADTANHWAKESIATAAFHGIVSGYDETTFGPDDLITREQMAAMIVKAVKLNTVTEETDYADNANISDWAREAIATATRNKIMNGYPDNTIRPRGNATRAETVAVILNATGGKPS